MTLKEIATQTQFSIATVSRVLNNPNTKYASQKTKDIILNFASTNGYIPNEHAKALRNSSENNKTKISKHLGCILVSSQGAYNNPFYAEVMRGIEREAIKMNCTIDCCLTIKTNHILNDLQSDILSNLDGIILLGKIDAVIPALAKKFSNLIYVGVNKTNFDIDEISILDCEAVITAMSYLINLKHKKIGFLGNLTKEKNILSERYRGFLEGMKTHNLEINRSFVQDSESSVESGYFNMKKILSHGDHPSAVICANDLIAIGALKAMEESKLKNHISIIGIDNIEIVERITPSLTTIHIPKEEMGQMAIKIIVDRIEHGHKLPVKISFPFKLVKRESCQEF